MESGLDKENDEVNNTDRTLGSLKMMKPIIQTEHLAA